MPPLFQRHSFAWPLFFLAAPALAQDRPPALDPVTIEGHYDNAVGTSDAASQGQVRRELLKNRPALRPGEVLEFIPGVIVTQHSGDGKANQYFLRGFNLDHGTDFASWVQGTPVNMPTHGHGQGYADLNFLIPELVDRIEYRKGPYFASNGDFSLAGSAHIRLRRAVEQPFAQLTLGGHGHARAVVAGSAEVRAEGPTLLGAVEAMRYDGPWVLPEKLRKYNLYGSLSDGSAMRGWEATFMGYDARWRSTDQVPQRAIDSGRLDRYGTVDPTDGGSSSRVGLSGEWRDRDDDGGWKVSGYLMRYDLQLYSNFTYALDRPATGDQFEQRDVRTVAGAAAARDWAHDWLGRDARLEAGVQLRHDRVQVGLYDTQAGRRTGETRADRVRQTGLGLYVEEHLPWTDWLRTVIGLRADSVRNRVGSSLAANSGAMHATKVSPTFSAVFGPWSQTEFFLNAGRGFHSNDARGTTTTVDPRTSDALTPVPALVSGKGRELGLRTQVVPGLQSSMALWRLESDSELVYVGDAGTTEEGPPSRRHGVEWNNRWMPLPWLLLDADFAWTKARFADGSRIAGAVERVASVATTVRHLGPWSASLQWRYLGPRPLTEDNSVRASSTLLTNLRLGYRLGRRADLTLDVFNVADRKVNDIEYYYESQLSGEAAPVEDRHVHPAEPRTVRLTLQVRF